jgi:alanyl-tRNA synthetase
MRRPLTSAEIRSAFLGFFEARGHTVVPSAPLVPDDPTLLLTNAGMVQFKPYFLGDKQPPFKRATSVQKCFRAIDLEEVGRTTRHLTFFEMLGNFSFGDYFKRDACTWAWELVTEGFGLEPERLWATVFTTDDEAAEIWEKEVGVPKERIVRRGRKDNFWTMGVAGPCGPCSELLYDRGDEFGPAYDGTGEMDEERYLEIWNLVFIQHIQDDAGTVIGDLPNKNVDTGAGLERIAAVLQDVPTAFQIDTLSQILGAAEEVTGKRYLTDPVADVSLRVLTDHARSMSFLIADGVLPGNEGRGYVLRRLIRRAVRHARLAGVDRPLLVSLTSTAVDVFGSAYPELERNRDLIARIVEKEESRFDQTLRQGLGMLEDEIAATKAAGSSVLPGAVAFKLHDTYGFPLDLAREIAEDESLTIDQAGFDAFMRDQRERARAARHAGGQGTVDAATLTDVLSAHGRTDFTGYQETAGGGSVLGIVRGGAGVPVLTEGQAGELVLDRTPFYPEGGGQIGDRGEIATATGTFRVADTRWGIPGVVIHEGSVTAGEVQVGQEVSAQVDPVHREGSQQAHTATHMIHWVLRDKLGEHARQHGSLVEPGRLHFDFSHFEGVPRSALADIEEEVNRRVLSDNPVRAYETTYDYATSIGAMALFGEKYGDYVRVVEVGDYSKELCGGTHVAHTGQVGVIKLLGESSIGAGLRRVEALTGMDGLAYLNRQAESLRQAAVLMKVEPDRLVERLEKTLETIKGLETELSKQRSAGQAAEVATILASDAVRPVGTLRLLALRRNGTVDELRKLAIALRDKLGSGVVLIGSALDGKANLVAGVTRDLTGRGVSAQAILADAAPILGGGSGGKPDLAVAGGSNASEIDAALSTAERSATTALEGAR